MMSKVMNVNIKNTNFPINSDINTENIISNINLEIPPDISSNFKSKINDSKPTKTYLRTQYDKPKITNSISCNEYDILIVTKDESFKFIPFVSVVHKTIDKGTTTTERLEEYVHNYDTSLLSKNKRHFIILTKNHSLIIQKLMLEKDEYVTKHHFVLDKYLFISTALIESEEKSTDGSLILYEMISIMADPKAPYKDKKLKFVCDIRTKASIKDFDIIYKIADKTFYTFEDLSICACVSTKINFYEVSHSGFTIVGRNESKLMTSTVKILRI
ncbi:hypothetical protein A0H76_1434 [Hepatospora eriocheir]|uniref:Uncharacterized protein n=1 Tax=Hepatospora eriocheir TaxID=1081669 RepID=A0A1X0QH20_9MICR|nr:hypothetical protein A0H76_1434 [Hepatospora eriocheir]